MRPIAARPILTDAVAIDPFRKCLLLNGVDDIGQAMQRAPSITVSKPERTHASLWRPEIAV